MVIHKRTRLTPIQRHEIYREYHDGCKKVSELADSYHVSRPTIYKIIRRGRHRNFSIHPGTNKRFRCLKYGIKRLSKIEEAIEARLKKQARRYNKDYFMGILSVCPCLRENQPLAEENIFLLPQMISLVSCMLRSFRTRPGIPPGRFWNRSWKNVLWKSFLR
jgi:predicted DNA-binding protein YlxM (UPF0122 family)